MLRFLAAQYLKHHPGDFVFKTHEDMNLSAVRVGDTLSAVCVTYDEGGVARVQTSCQVTVRTDEDEETILAGICSAILINLLDDKSMKPVTHTVIIDRPDRMAGLFARN